MLCAALAVLSCSTDGALPAITLAAQGVYAAAPGSIGFTVEPARAGLSYAMVLYRDDGAGYAAISTGSVAEPVSGQGTIALAALSDGSYRLELQVFARRGLGTYQIESLTRAAQFLIDTVAPVAPSSSEATGRFTGSLEVYLLHAELTAPTGSAVTVTYTTDGTDPTAESTAYEVGLPIELTTTTELRAIARDAAGNSSAVASWTYTLDT